MGSSLPALPMPDPLLAPRRHEQKFVGASICLFKNPKKLALGADSGLESIVYLATIFPIIERLSALY
jgi:hypothetical protein